MLINFVVKIKQSVEGRLVFKTRIRTSANEKESIRRKVYSL